MKLLHKYIYKFVHTKFFDNTLIILVILNTTVLALDGMFSSDNVNNKLTQANLIFSICFMIEMGIKIIALGINNYMKDTMNLFDGLVVILSLVEIIFMSGKNSAMSAFRSVRIFRTFRVLRVTRLLRALSFMKVIISVISRSIQSFIYVALLLVLFIFIYSLLGFLTFFLIFNFFNI